MKVVQGDEFYQHQCQNANRDSRSRESKTTCSGCDRQPVKHACQRCSKIVFCSDSCEGSDYKHKPLCRLKEIDNNNKTLKRGIRNSKGEVSPVNAMIQLLFHLRGFDEFVKGPQGKKKPLNPEFRERCEKWLKEIRTNDANPIDPSKLPELVTLRYSFYPNKIFFSLQLKISLIVLR